MTTSTHPYNTFNDGFDHPPTVQDLRELLGIDRCPTIHCGEDVVHVFAGMTQLRREVLVGCAVDRRSRLIGWNLIAAGPHDYGLKNIGGVFASAICESGAGVIVLRNSRVADLHTSPQEFAFICKVSEAAHMLGFALLDYLVLSPSAWCSLLERPLVEAFAGHVNLTTTSPASKKRGSQWQCGRCRKTNHKHLPVFPSIYGTYTPTHCAHCRTFAWLVSSSHTIL